MDVYNIIIIMFINYNIIIIMFINVNCVKINISLHITHG